MESSTILHGLLQPHRLRDVARPPSNQPANSRTSPSLKGQGQRNPRSPSGSRIGPSAQPLSLRISKTVGRGFESLRPCIARRAKAPLRVSRVRSTPPAPDAP